MWLGYIKTYSQMCLIGRVVLEKQVITVGLIDHVVSGTKEAIREIKLLYHTNTSLVIGLQAEF